MATAAPDSAGWRWVLPRPAITRKLSRTVLFSRATWHCVQSRETGRAHNNKLQHPHVARPFTFYNVGNHDMWVVDELACTAASEDEEANSLASE
ncbi:unnamed protein product [Boreogadus saida]